MGYPTGQPVIEDRKHIYLTGFSGSGKSTIGPVLARSLKRRFVDSDAEVERESGMTISEIFEIRGEGWFRMSEQSVIHDIACSRTPMVVALGGGAIQDSDVRRVVNKTGIRVYLSCSVRELTRRLSRTAERPMLLATSELKVPDRGALTERIAALLTKRRRYYEEAEIRVSTSKTTPSQSAKTIAAKLKKLHGID